MSCPHPPIKFNPCIFYGVEIWAAGRPNKPDNTSLLDEVGHHPGSVWGGVVILEDGLGSHLLEHWKDEWGHNFVSVAQACTIASHVVQGCPIAKTESSPYHDGAPTKDHPLLDGVVLVAFPLPSPHSLPPVRVVQIEPGFVAEEHLGPVQ